MSDSFQPRSRCPACQCAKPGSLLKIPFDDPVLIAGMTRLYDDVGHFAPAAVAGGIYELHECPDCGLIYQASVPNEALMTDVYETWHNPEKTRERWTAQLDPRRRLEIAREVSVAWSLARRKNTPLRVLDYGCGLGMWGGMAHAFGAETWGLEFSPSRRAHCAALGLKMADEADLPRDFFDYIHLDQVLEHLTEPRTLLQKLLPLLRPGGVICVAVPQGRRVKKHLPNWPVEFARPNLGRLMPVVPLLHLNCFNHQSLRRLGETCGLARLRPPLAALLPLWGYSSGWRGMLKSLVLPFYLRSAITTRIYFRRPDAASSSS